MMETIAVAILGLNGTLVGALIWLLKSTFTRLFGNDKDQGILSKFNLTLVSLNEDVQENTRAIRELRDYQKQHARSQQEANDTLAQILRQQKETGQAG